MEYGAHQSTKPQAPEKLQISSSKPSPSDVVAIRGDALRFWAWNFSGAWDLKLPSRVNFQSAFFRRAFADQKA
jgi:hypothetical protein